MIKLKILKTVLLCVLCDKLRNTKSLLVITGNIEEYFKSGGCWHSGLITALFKKKLYPNCSVIVTLWEGFRCSGTGTSIKFRILFPPFQEC